MQKATRPGWFEREDWVPIHWADMEWCRGICLKIHISFILVFCTLHIYLNKFTSTYYVCIYYWFISGILPFIFKTWLSEKAKKWQNSPPRHVCCSHPPRQIPNVHYLSVLVQNLHHSSLSKRQSEVSNSSGWQWPSAAVWPKCNPGSEK